MFISHSQADNVFGVKLAEDLRAVAGDPTVVWYDSVGELYAGDSWWNNIVSEISERPIFLVIWSPDAKDSKWVNDEISLAWRLKNGPAGKVIIPLIYRKCELRPDLKTLQTLSFVRPEEYKDSLRALIDAANHT
jgi:hypothetical protein